GIENQAIPGPKRKPRDQLHRFLDAIAEEGICVLHVLNNALLTEPLRQWLLSEIKFIPNLRIVFSCHPTEKTDQIAPDIPSLRLEFTPLDKTNFFTVIDQRFVPHTFPRTLVDALWRASRGLPGDVALKILDLVNAELLYRDERDIWHLADSRLAETDYAKEFLIDFQTVMEAALSQLPQLEQDYLQDFLKLAALCGEYVPVGLVFQYLQIDDDTQDTLTDFIDEHLVGDQWDGLFVDYEYRHLSFPEISVYHFVNPMYRWVILYEWSPDQRSELASGFLAFLEKRLPVRTRGIAHLFLTLCRYLCNEQAQAPYKQTLAWWIGTEEAEELTRYLAQALQERRLEPVVLLQIVKNVEYAWPTYRQLAVLNALDGQEQGVSVDLMGDFLNWKGVLLTHLGRYRDAERLILQALAIRESTLGSVHSLVATTLQNLAGSYFGQGRYAEAEPHYRRALAIIEENAHGFSRPNVATMLNNLAILYLEQGRCAEAEPLLLRALTIQESTLIVDHPEVATTINNLASLYLGQSRYAEAELHFQRALTIQENALRPDHHNVATTLHNLANLYSAQGCYTKAEPRFQRALAIRESTLDPCHPHIASTLENYAVLLQQLERFDEAAELVARAAAIRAKHEFENHNQ
ncbi:MAG: tetratricopeptide repeat protein, partial [Candidatus Competibacteraceae bacterium]|nr:tetratricopeptide repeat protein [Candidatus Competibacteraceae bacterium]